MTGAGSPTLRTLLDSDLGTSPVSQRTTAQAGLCVQATSKASWPVLVQVQVGCSALGGGHGLGSHSVGDWSWWPLSFLGGEEKQSHSPSPEPAHHTFRSCLRTSLQRWIQCSEGQEAQVKSDLRKRAVALQGLNLTRWFPKLQLRRVSVVMSELSDSWWLRLRSDPCPCQMLLLRIEVWGQPGDGSPDHHNGL